MTSLPTQELILQACDPRLLRVVSAWQKLQPHIRETISLLIDASISTDIQHDKLPKATRGTPQFSARNLARLGRQVLKALRHCPEEFNWHLDCEGWLAIELLKGSLLNSLASTSRVEHIVKQLIVYLGDRIELQSQRIRATYGHSTTKFSPTNTAVPIAPLFHGTSEKCWPTIELFGLLPKQRRFVQLTSNFEYASQIAYSRGSDAIVLQVATRHAIEEGVEFYATGTHVWLASIVPSDCLHFWRDSPPESLVEMEMDQDWLWQLEI